MLVAACAAVPQATPSSTPTEAPPSSSPILPSPTSATSPSPTTSPAALAFPLIECCAGEHVRAGRYALPEWLSLPAQIDVPSGWRVLNEPRARLFMLGRGSNTLGNPDEVILLANASGSGSLTEIVERITSSPELTPLAPLSEVEIAGLPGVQADVQAKPNPGFGGIPADDIPAGVQYLPAVEEYLAPGFSWTTSSPEAIIRVLALSADQGAWLVYLEAPAADFDDLAERATEIIDSLRIADE
jgi:hypothetical protein